MRKPGEFHTQKVVIEKDRIAAKKLNHYIPANFQKSGDQKNQKRIQIMKLYILLTKIKKNSKMKSILMKIIFVRKTSFVRKQLN